MSYGSDGDDDLVAGAAAAAAGARAGGAAAGYYNARAGIVTVTAWGWGLAVPGKDIMFANLCSCKLVQKEMP